VQRISSTIVFLCLGSASLLAVASAAARSATPSTAGSGVEITKGTDALEVKIDGKLFTRYIFAGAPKPYLWPIIGPSGDPITRAYPMRDVAGEKHDHPHQRSLWFTHGLVNGIDFWAETDKSGHQVHRAFEAVEASGTVGRIRAVNDWVVRDGDQAKKICEDTRELRIYATQPNRMLDFDITIRASDGDVTFGDTKEGMFGVRVASSMDVDQPQKGQPGGHIVNSRGESDAKAWGRPAEWVDYSGPVNGKTVGITILNHPSSFRHPTHWHVRTYGLFAANPFGLHDFSNDKSKDGSYTIPRGESITFRYRVVFHEGDASAANPAAAYQAYIGDR
jgi:hypothetical protein